MSNKLMLIGASLMISSTSFALDLQREELLNLYHGVENQQADASYDLSSISSGFVSNYQQGNEHDEIQFVPLTEPKTTIGVFTSDSLHEELSKRREYEFKTPKQFGHNEVESVGLYIKKSF